VAGRSYISGIEVKNLPSGTYPVTMYNAAKCIVGTMQFTIREKEDCDSIAAILVPSAFTPNGDGKNDILMPLKNPVGKMVSFVFRVYNRNGQVLFESMSPGKGWDGRYKGVQQPTAVYVWMFQGIDAGGKQVSYSGTTVLIR
jgi:gliding motility-associated-like protein